MKRRDFVAATAAVSAAPAFPALAITAAGPGSTSSAKVQPPWAGADLRLWDERTLPDHVTKPVFDRHLGERFDFVLTSGKRVSARLVETAEVRSKPQRARLPSLAKQVFSADFRVAAGDLAEADVAYLQHPAIGRMLLKEHLSLVPAGPDGRGLRYVAYFN